MCKIIWLLGGGNGRLRKIKFRRKKWKGKEKRRKIYLKTGKNALKKCYKLQKFSQGNGNGRDNKRELSCLYACSHTIEEEINFFLYKPHQRGIYVSWEAGTMSRMSDLLYVQEVVTQPKILNKTISSNIIHLT